MTERITNKDNNKEIFFLFEMRFLCFLFVVVVVLMFLENKPDLNEIEN